MEATPRSEDSVGFFEEGGIIRCYSKNAAGEDSFVDGFLDGGLDCSPIVGGMGKDRQQAED